MHNISIYFFKRCKRAWTVTFDLENAKRSSNPTMFLEPYKLDSESVSTIPIQPDFTKFIVKNPSFLLFGRMLKTVYDEYMTENNLDLICTKISLQQICDKSADYAKNFFPGIDQESFEDWILLRICKSSEALVSQFSTSVYKIAHNVLQVIY